MPSTNESIVSKLTFHVKVKMPREQMGHPYPDYKLFKLATFLEGKKFWKKNFWKKNSLIEAATAPVLGVKG